jgi:hypothetical protein
MKLWSQFLYTESLVCRRPTFSCIEAALGGRSTSSCHDGVISATGSSDDGEDVGGFFRLVSHALSCTSTIIMSGPS